MVELARVRGDSFIGWCGMVLALSTSACGSDGGGKELDEADGPTSTVEVALTTVPPSTQCVRITATPSSGTATVKTFTVTAGSSSANLSVGRLQVGNYTLSGDAFTVACSSIGSNVGEWLADPVAITMKAGVTSNVTLTFRKNNPLTASVNFVNNVLSASVSYFTSFVVTDGGLLGSGYLANGTKTFSRLNFSAFDATSIPGNAVTRVASIETGACAARADGTLWCWGTNDFGELGPGIPLGTTAASPVQVAGVSAVTQLVAGAQHFCAIGNYGAAVNSVLCWGAGHSGQLGNNSTLSRSTPAVVLGEVKDIACGGFSSYAVMGSGAILAWGANGAGQLGDGTTMTRLIPTAVSGESTVQAVAGGGSHACALRADGSVRCWGQNGNGQLGIGTTTNSPTPALLSGLAARKLSAGLQHTCAITTAGQTMCWGFNAFGQLGDGTATTRTSPVPTVLGGVTLSAVAASSTAHQTCGIASNSDLYCWGLNHNSQLGDGTTNYAFLPIKPQLQ